MAMAMAKNLAPYDQQVVEDDEYIDMDISTSTTTTPLCYNLPSPQHPTRDFEFKMSSNQLEAITDHIPSPADELFYKGNLLPLHLPPRLQLVEKLLLQKNSKPQHYSFTTAPTTPFESCNISPANSCYVSSELTPEDYCECPNIDFILESHTKKRSWSRKLKLIKHYSALGLKIKASRAYFKSLFAKPVCSDDVVCATDRKRTSSNKSGSDSSSCSSSNSSSFSSVKSNGFCKPQKVKTSSSVNSENECSVQGAIAYCKKSQQQDCGIKSVSDVEFYLLSESRIAAECKK